MKKILAFGKTKITRNMEVWNPLHPDELSFQFGSYGFLVLNREITLNPLIVEKLWNEAAIRWTADGGTDRWFDFLKRHKLNLKSIFPHSVSGDFDSIRKETLDYCRENGVLIHHTPDQNMTDFQKSLKLMGEKGPNKLTSIVALCDTSGRLDQVMSLINTIGSTRRFIDNLHVPNVFLLSNNSLTWLINKGNHTIKIPKHLVMNQVWCALMPFEPVKNNSVTTSGLKWNLDKTSLQFGGLVSTSNTYSGESEVTIKTDADILWSMGLSLES